MIQALAGVLIVLLIALAGVAAGAVAPVRAIAGIALPYASFVVLVAGVACQVWRWARVPVPFRIPTTAGQQTSLAWIQPVSIDNPASGWGVTARMALEVLLFRSLFRNSAGAIAGGPRLVVREDKVLWLGALAFHWSLLLVVVRHLRLFFEPVPAGVRQLSAIDSFFQTGITPLYVTDLALILALGYLLGRRILNARMRFLSLFTDYLALVLLLALAGSGLVMRHVTGVDLVAVKQYAMGLAMLSPRVPPAAGSWFFAHLFLVCALLVYLPFSKLMHSAGVFLSPTRNLPNDSRARRHVNPWNAPGPVHTYEEWEDEFRDGIRAAGLPLEKA